MGDAYHEPNETLKSRLKSVPIHNIVAERVLGMTDGQSHCAPNAQLHFISNKVKIANNNTLKWMESKTEAERINVINYAKRHDNTIREVQKMKEDRLVS